MTRVDAAVAATMIFDRSFVSPCAGAHTAPGRCPHCERELEPVEGSPRRYCGPGCRKAVYRLPADEREARRADVPDGMCVACGADLPPPTFRCPRSKNGWLKVWRANSGGRLRFGLEWREWLAEKLGGLDPTDPRLDEIALALARAGKLTICVEGDRIIGVAKPRAPRVPARA